MYDTYIINKLYNTRKGVNVLRIPLNCTMCWETAS